MEHLGMYFEELGAKQKRDSFPYVFEAEGWRGEILEEKEIAFTQSFKVNSIKIRFYAVSEKLLNETIKHYRYKTTRIGG